MPSTTTVDHAMELLTMVSRRYVPVATLAMDLDIAETRVLATIKRLQKAGFDLAPRLGRVRVRRDGWSKVKLAAEAYHERTYGY